MDGRCGASSRPARADYTSKTAFPAPVMVTTEIWVSFIVIGVAVIAGVVLVNYLVDQARLRRMRQLASINLFLHHCWSYLDDVPPQYLPTTLRYVLAKAMLARLNKGLRLAPDNASLIDQARRLEEFVTVQDGVVVPVVAARRRDIRRQLLSIKHVCLEAGAQGVIGAAELADAESIVNALTLRILVDYLVDTADADVHAKKFDEAIALLERAIAELRRLPGPDTSAERAGLSARIVEVRAGAEAHKKQLEIEAEETLARNWASTAPTIPIHPPTHYGDVQA